MFNIQAYNNKISTTPNSQIGLADEPNFQTDSSCPWNELETLDPLSLKPFVLEASGTFDHPELIQATFDTGSKGNNRKVLLPQKTLPSAPAERS